MRKSLLRTLLSTLAAAGTLWGGALAAHEGHEASTGPAVRNIGDLPRATRQELAAVRKATARYQQLEAALADGYVDISVYYPQMGYHYLKPELLDDQVDLESPELLVYEVDEYGKARLVAVEYAVPVGQVPGAPEGFTGDADVWTVNADFNLWTLHVWIWYHNPDGVFAAHNPRVR